MRLFNQNPKISGRSTRSSTARHTPLTFPFASLALTVTLALALLVTRAAARTAQRRDFRPLSDAAVRDIVQLEPKPWTSVEEGHLRELLIPRVSGTENNTKVQNYISGVFKGLGWHEEKVSHKQTPPVGDFGEIEFTNLIYTFDPDAPRKLVLSAHFDSKWFAQGGFIGATDSSAPCGFLLDIAEALTPLLRARADRLAGGQPLLTAELDEAEAAETTLQIVFFDGEEAFGNWRPGDSVYGSTNLAQVWDETFLPAEHVLSQHAARRLDPPPSVLDTMDVLVLLDLLGSRGPRIESYYRETDWLFSELRAADERVRQLDLVRDGGDPGWFLDDKGQAWMMDDDHRPFLHRGVPVLHVISNPFPQVWHTMTDNADALDMDVMYRWCSLLRVFTAGYLGLSAEDTPVKPNGADTVGKVGSVFRSDEL